MELDKKNKLNYLQLTFSSILIRYGKILYIFGTPRNSTLNGTYFFEFFGNGHRMMGK